MIKNKKNSLLIGIVILLLVVLGILTSIFITHIRDPYNSRIVAGVSIAGVDVSGMTKAEARKAVKAVAGQYETTDFVVKLPDREIRFTPADTGAKLDIAKVVNAAYVLGRDTQLPQGTCVIELASFLHLNTDYIQSALDAYAAGFDGVYTETTYSLQGEMPQLAAADFDPEAPCQDLVIQIGTPGLAVDMEALYRQILDAYNRCQFSVASQETSATAIPEPLDAHALLAEFGIEPVNATINTETYSAIPGAWGYGFDPELVQQILDASQYGETVTIPMQYIPAEITEENVFFQDMLGYCETKHTDDENRNTNLRLVCEILTGLILQPGEEFSFNDRVGERTKERGFLPAPGYSGLVLTQQYGGGVCQTSSTLYNCALLADMEITNRLSHGYKVGYLPIGLDATVNWGFTDFKFRNTSNYPIMLGGEVSDGMVKMWILGVDDKDYYVKMEAVHSVEENAIYAVSYRCKYDKETDELISREVEARSSYRR